MNKLKYIAVSMLMFLSACEIVRVVEPVVVGDMPPAEVTDVGFSLVTSNVLSTNVSLRASWAKPTSDGRGDPEYYLHTMTANKTVSGTLPTRKRVNGLADTITIGRPAVNDTIILTSQVWSVRRGLESSKAATGRLVIRTGDAPPPPPDTVIVDTIVLAPEPPPPGIKVDNFFTLLSEKETSPIPHRTLFIREEDGTTVWSDKNTTYITLVKH